MGDGPRQTGPHRGIFGGRHEGLQLSSAAHIWSCGEARGRKPWSQTATVKAAGRSSPSSVSVVAQGLGSPHRQMDLGFRR